MLLISTLLLASFNIHAAIRCSAYCLVLEEYHVMIQVSDPAIQSAFAVNANSPTEIIRKFRDSMEIGVSTLGKRVLARSYTPYEYRWGMTQGTFLKSYVPATISNSCVKNDDIPLLD